MDNPPELFGHKLDPTLMTDLATWELLDDIRIHADMHTGLAKQVRGNSGYFVFHDASMAWNENASLPQNAAVALQVDPVAHAFRLERSYQATLPLAQRWLAGRGADPNAFELLPNATDRKPADSLTEQLEAKLRASGDRYHILSTTTLDVDPTEVRILAEDKDTDHLPIRLFVEETDLATGVYTLREGAFPSEEAADLWVRHRNDQTPMPSPIEHAAERRRADAASARSTTATSADKTATSPVSTPTPDPVDRKPRKGR